MSERDIGKWAKWEDLGDEVRRWVPGVPSPDLTFAVRDASVELFEETHGWRYTVEENLPITFPPVTAANPTPNGNALYAVPLPDFTLLAGVGYLGYFDPAATQPRPLWPLDEWTLKRMTRVVPATAAALGWLDYVGAPANYLIWNDHTSLRIYPTPAPNQVGGVLTELIVYLIPNRRAQGLPVYLMDRFYRELAKGAAAKLRKTPDRAWTDMAQGQSYDDEFGEMKVKVMNALRRNRTEAQPTGSAMYPVA